jgi:outer membrane receptor protein involved in Fe transport
MNLFYLSLKLLFLLFLFSNQTFSQIEIEGTVYDLNSEEPIDNVKITFNKINCTFTDSIGFFEINLKNPLESVLFEKKGYYNKLSTQFKANPQKVYLEPELVMLNEVRLSGSTHKHSEKFAISITNKKFPILKASDNLQQLKKIPSIYLSEQGGGNGDGTINFRGLAPSYTHLLINDIDVNDVESDWIYWSNWSHLFQFANTLTFYPYGNSNWNLSPTQGGSINLSTFSKSKKNKTQLLLKTGSSNTWGGSINHHHFDSLQRISSTFFIGKNVSQGLVQGTKSVSNAYYFDFSKVLGKHNFNFFILGAPQWHQQRSNFTYHMATLKHYLNYGKLYNYNYGTKAGVPFTWTENYYHKNLNGFKWSWLYNGRDHVALKVYSSLGAGGSTYESGNTPEGIYGQNLLLRNIENGQVLWDKIVAYNKGNSVFFPEYGTIQRTDIEQTEPILNAPFNKGLSKIGFTNYQSWVGTQLSLTKNISSKVETLFKYQYRYSKSDSFDRLIDPLGADGYVGYFDQNNPYKTVYQTIPSNIFVSWNLLRKPVKYDKLNFHYQSKIGIHTINNSWDLTLKKWNLSTNYLITLEKNKRVDFFNYLSTDPNRVSTTVNKIGWMANQFIKYKTHWGYLYFNGQILKKPPRFESIYLNYKNDINPNIQNERSFSYALGMVFQKNKWSLSSTLYHYKIKNKYLTTSYEDSQSGVGGTAFLDNLQQKSFGWESTLEFTPNDKWKIKGNLTLSDTYYYGLANGIIYNIYLEPIKVINYQLDKLKSGAFANWVGRLQIQYVPLKRLTAMLHLQYFNKLYAHADFSTEQQESLKLPTYSLIDFHTNYSIKLGENKELDLSFLLKNLTNKTYISTAYTSITKKNTDTWKGVPVENKVFFGLPRTYSFGLQYTIF